MKIEILILLSLMVANISGQMQLTKVRTTNSKLNSAGSMKIDDDEGFQYYGIFTMGTPGQ